MKRLPDPRYIVTRSDSYPGPRYVARFCGDVLASAETHAGAVAIARAHRVAFLRPLRARFARAKLALLKLAAA
jgi:hypothetical protein